MTAILGYWKFAAFAPMASPYVDLFIDQREWLDPKNASPSTTNYMLMEWPIVHHQGQACIDVLFDSNGVRSIVPLLYIFTAAGVTILSDKTADGTMVKLETGTDASANVPPACLFYDPAPRWLELLIGISKEIYAPYLEAEDVRQALTNQLLYANHGPSLVPKFEPNQLQKHKLAICILWPDWQLRKLSWAERAFELEQVGIFDAKRGETNVNGLQQICRRLQLKMNDKVN